MCTEPGYTTDSLPGLRNAYDGVIGAYANIGYVEAAPEDPQNRAIDWGENTPERYAGYGREWIGMGGQIIGGCCASGPEHIEALRPVVKG